MFQKELRGLPKIFDTDVSKGKVIIIIGDSGTLKSGFAYNFLYNYLRINKDEYATYITFEQTRKSHLENMKSFGLKPHSHLQIVDIASLKMELEDTGKIDFSSGRLKRRFDKWRAKLPQVNNEYGRKTRLRSTYFELTLYFDNTANRELILDRILYYYDIQML